MTYKKPLYARMRKVIGTGLVSLYRRHTGREATYSEALNEIAYIDENGVFRREVVTDKLKDLMGKAIHESIFNEIESRRQLWN